LELRQYLDILKRHKWLIIQATVIVAVAAYLFSDLKTPAYQSTARILLRPNDAAEQLYPGYSVEVFSDPDRYVSSQIDIIQSEAVADLAGDALPGNDDPAALLGEVGASQGGLTDVVDVTGYSIDPVRARDVANAFAKAYIENRRLYAVAGLQKAVDELDAKLKTLEQQIAEYDQRIGDGGLTPGAVTALERPEGSGLTGPERPESMTDTPEGTGLDNGAAPTSDEALKAARYASATQYQSLFFRKQELEVDISLKRGNAELIADAKTPGAPYSPTPRKDAMLGAFVGLLLGVGLSFLREQLDDRIRNRDDVARATGLPVLVDLPRVETTTAGLPDAIAKPHGPMAEASRTLRTSLAFLGIDSPIRRILVTSPGPGDGKSTVAANLAAVYAQAGQTTILVSGDLRRPTLERIFGVAKGKGLSEELVSFRTPTAERMARNGNGTSASDASAVTDLDKIGASLVPVGPDDLYLLPAGPTPPNPAELLGSNRMAQLLDELDRFADIVIVDTPPLLAVTDAAALAPQVDAVVLVTAVGETNKGAAKRAHELIANADVKYFTVVLNKVDPNNDGYYRYYDYYGESERTKKKKRGLGRRARQDEQVDAEVTV
jgi:succinoglycan biosynthesis transport protein ExoP